MADTNTNKQFLDFSGLKKFWSLINDKFATKSTAVGSVTYTADANGASLVVKAVDNTDLGTQTIAAATSTTAGLMSAQDKINLDAAAANTKFKGIALQDGDNTAVDIAKDSKAVIKLSYDSENKLIKLADVNGTAYSSIDASVFVKDGILDNVTWSTVPGEENVLMFTFNTDSGKQAIPVNLSKFVDTYVAGNGLALNGKSFSIVLDETIADKPSYLTVSDKGIRVDDALWIKVGELDTAVATAAASDATKKAGDALAEAKGYTNAQIGGPLAEGTTVLSKIAAAESKASTDLVAAVGNYSVKGEDGSVTTPATGLRAEIETKETELKTYADGKAATAETNAKNFATQEIAKIVGDGGTLAGTLEAAKSYTDAEIAKVNVVIGKAAAGEGETATPATGLYKYIDDADAKVLVDAKAYADGLAKDYDEAGAAAGVKDYADKTFVKLDGYVAYTGEEKTKLAGIETGAQVNVIESVKVNGVTATIENKVASVNVDCYTQSEIDGKFAAVDTKIGTVPADKDVVTMIADAKAAANGYADGLFAGIIAINPDDITLDNLNA